jgi:hypothetical protein
MDSRSRAAIGAIICAAAIGLSAEQTGAPQNPDHAARNHVVIGCISREGPSTTSRDDAAAGTTFVITDTRGKPPLKYRLEGDADQLRMHVGHTLEIAGRIVPAATARSDATAGESLPTLKVQSLTYISMTCSN